MITSRATRSRRNSAARRICLVFLKATGKSEVGSRKSEVGSRKSEVGSRKSEVGSLEVGSVFTAHRRAAKKSPKRFVAADPFMQPCMQLC